MGRNQLFKYLISIVSPWFEVYGSMLLKRCSTYFEKKILQFIKIVIKNTILKNTDNIIVIRRKKLPYAIKHDNMMNHNNNSFHSMDNYVKKDNQF